ncbi:DUF983 domain-containing protein [Acuticoccus sp. M5D2P5]|nr:DUF983 domain-containing protein [Acuticoccus kalidii]MCF3935111.1 DUF983 domain-containing protein [Acuticoccus kalidii]
MSDELEKQNKNARRAKGAAFFTLLLVGAIVVGILIVIGAVRN